MSSDWFLPARFDGRIHHRGKSGAVGLTVLLLSLPPCRPHLALEYSGKVRLFSDVLWRFRLLDCKFDARTFEIMSFFILRSYFWWNISSIVISLVAEDCLQILFFIIIIF